LCQQYIVAIEDLQAQIKVLEKPSRKTHHIFSHTTPVFGLQSNLKQNTITNDKNGTETEKIRINKCSDFCTNVNPNIKNERLVQKKVIGCQTVTTKNLDCEELSELSTSDSEGSRVLGKCKSGYINRIDCFYTQIKRKRMGQRTRWLNKLKLGVMFTNGREYLFKDALLDIDWDITKQID